MALRGGDVPPQSAALSEQIPPLSQPFAPITGVLTYQHFLLRGHSLVENNIPDQGCVNPRYTHTHTPTRLALDTVAICPYNVCLCFHLLFFLNGAIKNVPIYLFISFESCCKTGYYRKEVPTTHNQHAKQQIVVFRLLLMILIQIKMLHSGCCETRSKK